MYPFRKLTKELAVTEVSDKMATPIKTKIPKGVRVEIIRVQQGTVAFGLLDEKRKDREELLMFSISERLMIEYSEAI